MKLADYKTSDIPKRKLFQIERAVVREITDQWYYEHRFYADNFSEDVEITPKGKSFTLRFLNKDRMQQGAPDATTNEMMKGLLLTMASNQDTGGALKNYKAIIGNILDVFVHRLKEIEDRKFIFQRLQTLELGFGIGFGLDKDLYSIKKTRPLLEDALTVASLSQPGEAVEVLIQDILATDAVVAHEHGVTFHIIMERKNEASFLSLPLGMERASYVSLLGTHTLRCNILAELEGPENLKSGILKIDAPSDPLKFIRHKGFALDLDPVMLMDKLRSSESLPDLRFSQEELTFLKLLYNEYVQLAAFLLRSKRIAHDMRLLLIFPRINFFAILHNENKAIPLEEPQHLGELAALIDTCFRIKKTPGKAKPVKSHRIPERIIQEQVVKAMLALARNILQNLYKPVAGIKRAIQGYVSHGCDDPSQLAAIKALAEDISRYLKMLQLMQRVALDDSGTNLDTNACIATLPQRAPQKALDEIVQNIQTSEVEQTREVVVSKMLDYLSLLSVKIEQLEKVSSAYIKEEISKEIDETSGSIMIQARSFYNLMVGKTGPRRK
ncbi:MAG: hypothetical protein GY868_18565 [Deltaproteobacteria bacterium]|nr:hypothetical protein [Deltaproteobacteria bacterium]